MPLTVADLTTESLDGTGIFDALMRSVSAHISDEYQKGRIRGPEYSTVYLGAMQSVLDRALTFLLEKDKTDMEVTLLAAQVNKVAKDIELVDVQITNAGVERNRTTAQIAQIEQQTANLVLESANIPKQGLVLDGQKCKLDAEFDVLVQQKLKAIADTALMEQKKKTEEAQVVGNVADADSVIGKQKALYTAQTDGFTKDAQQKAADIMLSAYRVNASVDPDNNGPTVSNKLLDENIGSVISVLMQGVGATVY